MGRVRVIEFVAKEMCFRERWDAWCCSDQVSHVNSPDHKKPANATQSADLTLIPSSSGLISLTILRRIGAVSGNRSLLTPSPYTHFPPLMMRSMRGLSKIVVGRADLRWREWR